LHHMDFVNNVLYIIDSLIATFELFQSHKLFLHV